MKRGMVSFYNHAFLHASLCQNWSRPINLFPYFDPHHGIASVQIYAQFWAKKLRIWAAGAVGAAAATMIDGLIISISSENEDDAHVYLSQWMEK